MPLDIVDAVLLDSPAIELVEALARGTDVDIENVNVGIRIFFPVSMAGLAVSCSRSWSSIPCRSRRYPGSHALDEHDGVGCLPSEGRSSVPLVGPAALVSRSNSREVMTSLDWE